MKNIAFLFLSLIAFFTVQPLISSQRMPGIEQAVRAMRCCAKMMKCPKKNHPANNKGKCDGSGCNPFMACAYGNFYLVEASGITFLSIIAEKKKKTAINDNRLSTSFSESWHPPELILHIG